MKLLYSYLRGYKPLVALALVLATINQVFSLLDPLIFRYGFFMNWSGAQAGEGFEYHLLAIGLAIAIVIRGGGDWSLDQVVSRKY